VSIAEWDVNIATFHLHIVKWNVSIPKKPANTAG
jgi:hypothetical protein